MSKQIEIIDGLVACNDCTIAIANGDFSGMDDAVEAVVRAGIKHLCERGYPVIGEQLGFMHRKCDCCGALPGDRHELSLIVL